MLSEHVHAESLFITIPGGEVKEEFLISDDTGEKKQQINKKNPKTPNEFPQKPAEDMGDLSLCSHSKFWK